MATACNDRYCGETGQSLPIARYIPVPNSEKTKDLPARLVANLPKLAPSLKYALTMMRSGYLYAYNDTSKVWDGYFIPEANETGESYRQFHRFLAKKTQAYVNVQNNLNKHSAAKFDFTQKNGCDCKHPKSHESILVEGVPSKQKNLYYIFSDVEWNSTNFKSLEKIEAKDKYMQKVDLKAYIAAKGKHEQAHVLNTTELTDLISYAVNQAGAASGYKRGKSNKDKSANKPSSFELQFKQTDKTINGATCAIDPVGVLEELTNIAQRGHNSFSSSAFMKANAYQYWMKDTLDSLRFGIKTDAVQRLFEEHYFERELSLSNKRGKKLSEAEIAELNQNAARAASENSLAKAGDYAWKKYQNCFKEPSYKDFSTKLGTAAKAHSDQNIEPAAKSIVTWLKFSRTTNYFDICFDKNDKEHSTVFPQVFLKCTQSTGEFGTCNNLFYQWLTNNTDNLLIRALYLNNTQVKGIVEKQNSHFSKAGADFLKSVDWNGTFTAFKGIFSPKQIEVIDSFVGKITANVSASLVELNSKLILNQAVGNKAFFLTALHAGEAFTLQKISLADRKASIDAFLQKTFDVQNVKKAINGKNPTSDRTKENILKNYRALRARLNTEAETFQRKNGHSGYFFVNAAKIAPGDAYAKQLGKSTLVLSEREVMNLMAVSETKGAAYKRVTAGVLSGILFSVSMIGWFSKDVKPEQTTTAYAQLFSLVLGFSGEVMERASGRKLAVAAGTDTLSNRAKGLAPKQFTRHTRINVAGRLFGGTAAIILGVLDIISAAKLSRQENYSALVILQGVSGGLGIVLGSGIIASMIATTFPIAARIAGTIMPRAPYLGMAILIAAILIMLLTDNELETWIKDTIWGTNNYPKYSKDFAGARNALSEIIKKANN